MHVHSCQRMAEKMVQEIVVSEKNGPGYNGPRKKLQEEKKNAPGKNGPSDLRNIRKNETTSVNSQNQQK